MFFISKADREKFSCGGIDFEMLVARDLTGCCECVVEYLPVGERTPEDRHAHFHQIFYVLEGEGRLRMGADEFRMKPHSAAFIPQNTPHDMESTGESELVFFYINVWPDQIPPSEREWRRTYQAIGERRDSDSSSET